MTPEQIAANRKSAMNLALTRTKLNDIPKAEWTYDQRAAYNKALASIIAENPQSFDAQDVATAKQVERADYSPLSSADFSFSDFGSAVVDNVVDAGGKVANVGTGVLNTVAVAGKLLPWVAIAGGLFLAYSFFKGKGAKLAK